MTPNAADVDLEESRTLDGHDLAFAHEHFYWTSGEPGTPDYGCGSGRVWKASGLTHIAEEVGPCPGGSNVIYRRIRRRREGDPEWVPYEGWPDQR